MIDKIRKMLALSTSANQGEAENALAMAQQLMVKHNITMQQLVNQPTKEYENLSYGGEGGKAAVERKYILPILQKYFFVKAMNIQQRGNANFFLIGTKENVEIAKYVYDYLKVVFYVLFKLYALEQKKNGIANTTIYKQSFYAGLRNGLMDKLAKERTSVENEMGLVLVEDPGLNKALHQFFPNSIMQKSPVVAIYGDVRNEGYKKGQTININPGIGGTKDQSLLLN